MLFAKQDNPAIIEYGLHTFTLLTFEHSGGLKVIKTIKQCPIGNVAEQNAILASTKEQLAPRSKYLRALCYVSPEERLLRRTEIDGTKFSDTKYLSEIVTTQFKIDPSSYDLVVLDAKTGQTCNTNTQTALFTGIPSAQAKSLQDKLISLSIYPEHMGISSLNTIGALINYSKIENTTTPTLILEIGNEQTYSYIISNEGLESTRPINQGINSMLPVIQKELGLKDEESARKLLQSNAFDFTSMNAALTKKLVKELQSSIGFYEVQTGQNIGQFCCVGLPTKMEWLQNSIEAQLGLKPITIEIDKWLSNRAVSIEKNNRLSTSSKELLTISFAVV